MNTLHVFSLNRILKQITGLTYQLFFYSPSLFCCQPVPDICHFQAFSAILSPNFGPEYFPFKIWILNIFVLITGYGFILIIFNNNSIHETSKFKY